MAPPIDQSTLTGFSTGSRTLVQFPHHPKLIAEARRRHPSKSRNGDLSPPRIHRVTTMFVTDSGSDALRKRPLLQRITLNKGISKSSPLRPSLKPQQSTYSIAAVPIFTGANTSKASQWVPRSCRIPPGKPGLHSLQEQKTKQHPVAVHRSHHSASRRAMPSSVVIQAQRGGVSPPRHSSVYHQPDLISPVNCREDRKN